MQIKITINDVAKAGSVKKAIDEARINSGSADGEIYLECPSTDEAVIRPGEFASMAQAILVDNHACDRLEWADLVAAIKYSAPLLDGIQPSDLYPQDGS